MEAIRSYFELEKLGTTIRTEVRAGMATFLTMAYILLVNPQILAQAGMPVEDVAAATAIASAVACLLMGLVARYPFALAPGMGLNAYFAFGIVLGMGVSWQTALAAVFVEGVLFVALSVGGFRRAVLDAIPQSLKIATMGGIGLFLAIIGLRNAGIVIADPGTMVALGDVRSLDALIAIGTLFLTAALMQRRVPGALLIGIILGTLAAWLTGAASPPEAWIVAPALPAETFLSLDFHGLLNGSMVAVVLALLFVDFFDTAGTLIGTGMLGGFVTQEGQLPRANQAFLSDAIGTSVGALLGTSTVTTYIESSAGIEEGGRSGLTAVVVGILFVASLAFIPLFSAVPASATAPVLLLVGAMMLQKLNQVAWTKPSVAVPAFLTVAVMPLTFSIANGIAAGILSFTFVKLLSGEGRSVPAMMYAISLILILYLAFVP